LESMGMAAVPSMIALMDDYRKLGMPSMSLVNKSPKAFEARRQYRPQLVIDALAALLTQITQEDFGHPYASTFDVLDEERERTIAGWRVYLHHLQTGTL